MEILAAIFFVALSAVNVGIAVKHFKENEYGWGTFGLFAAGMCLLAAIELII